mmetsp:Transcript_124518/g.360018  ORF Transcript_124518/g.360018 Transcript_124518/m.360018 type:complete len:227 (-) Transcript_124518:293-973(-)
MASLAPRFNCLVLAACCTKSSTAFVTLSSTSGTSDLSFASALPPLVCKCSMGMKGADSFGSFSPLPLPMPLSPLPPALLLPLPFPLPGGDGGGRSPNNTTPRACGIPSLFTWHEKVTLAPTGRSRICALWRKTSRWYSTYVCGHSMKPNPFSALKDLIRPAYLPGSTTGMSSQGLANGIIAAAAVSMSSSGQPNPAAWKPSSDSSRAASAKAEASPGLSPPRAVEM